MNIRKQGDWLAARVGNELVMLSAAKGNYLGLTAVGASSWELIETPQPVGATCDRLMEEFDVAPGICHHGVAAFGSEAEGQGATGVGAVAPLGHTDDET